MLVKIDLGIADNLAYSWSGRISEDDMLRVLTDIRNATADDRKISFYQEIHSFDGIELDALVEKIRLLFDISIRHFKTIVLVTDKKWMHKLALIEDRLFQNVSIQCFSSDKKADAQAFIKAE
ncbi:Uncharacterised protein [BD1-7 clade bacterium]|uniref:STAS/SEC14 domain-containing protein n=1 Tax=BD1-7 clade bacterium TaxID=2029982 RepID=A0A5S9N2D3_9GAMM|nr:Uncharacterised protein [BD1-7 clade bacterium]CAA0082801.1 Uncharacterised protein [BD1-7 clade bacterium]